MGNLGIITGQGNIVDLALNLLERQREEFYIIDLTGGEVLKRFPHCPGKAFGAGQVGSIIKTLKRAHVDRVLFLGKIDKRVLYKHPRVDLRAAKVLLTLRDFSDDSLLNAVIQELKKEKIRLVGQKEVLGDMIPPSGLLAGVEPNRKTMEDVAFGFSMALEIGRLGIGQTVVVKDRSVVAVESLEGTDETIKRGGALAGPGTVVVKVKRPSQSPLLDVPTVGLRTLEVMEGVKARALAVEAHETLVLNLQDIDKRSKKSGISLLAVDEAFLASWLASL